MKPLQSAMRFVVWREPIDREAEAWTAYGEVVRHGRLYAGATMLLAERGAYRHEMQEKLVLKLVGEARAGKLNSGGLVDSWRGIPFAGFVRDLRR